MLQSPAPQTSDAAAAPAFAWDGGPIVLVGLMGVGKSTVGRRLSQRLDLPFVDADVDVLVDRVRRRDSRPLLKGRDPREVLAELARIRNPLYAEAHIRVLSNRALHDMTVTAILKAIGR